MSFNITTTKELDLETLESEFKDNKDSILTGYNSIGTEFTFVDVHIYGNKTGYTLALKYKTNHINLPKNDLSFVWTHYKSDDIYINPPGSEVPLQFIYEGAHKWTKIGTQQDAIQPDSWECYEYYLKLDDKSVADGGEARVRMWKNGKLLADITDRITLKKPDGYADGAFLFTYWNSSPWIGQMACDNAKAFSKGSLFFIIVICIALLLA